MAQPKKIYLYCARCGGYKSPGEFAGGEKQNFSQPCKVCASWPAGMISNGSLYVGEAREVLGESEGKG